MVQLGPCTRRQLSAAFGLSNEELFCAPWKPKAKGRKWKLKVNREPENETVLSFFPLSLSARIEQDSKLLTMPRSQRSPPMSFSDPSTWEQMFQELIQEEKPRAKWTLQLDKNILPDNLTMGWRQYQQTGVGR